MQSAGKVQFLLRLRAMRETSQQGTADLLRQERGFTLIELLVVVVLIGVLTAMAIQGMHRYRQQAYDAAAMHDLANAVKAEEAYFATYQTYVSFSAVGPTMVAVPPTAISETVVLKMTGDTETFEGTATSSRGTGKVFGYDSITDTFVGN